MTANKALYNYTVLFKNALSVCLFVAVFKFNFLRSLPCTLSKNKSTAWEL